MDDVVGQSPKAYMQHLGREMTFDGKGFFKIIAMIIPNVFAYIIIANFIQGEMTFSTVQLIGFPLVAVLFLLAAAQAFRNMSVRTKESPFKNGAAYIADSVRRDGHLLVRLVEKESTGASLMRGRIIFVTLLCLPWGFFVTTADFL